MSSSIREGHFVQDDYVMITLLRTKEKQNCISDQTCDQKVIWFQVSVNDSKRVKVFNRKDRLGKIEPGKNIESISKNGKYVAVPFIFQS